MQARNAYLSRSSTLTDEAGINPHRWIGDLITAAPSDVYQKWQGELRAHAKTDPEVNHLITFLDEKHDERKESIQAQERPRKGMYYFEISRKKVKVQDNYVGQSPRSPVLKNSTIQPVVIRGVSSRTVGASTSPTQSRFTGNVPNHQSSPSLSPGQQGGNGRDRDQIVPPRTTREVFTGTISCEALPSDVPIPSSTIDLLSGKQRQYASTEADLRVVIVPDLTPMSIWLLHVYSKIDLRVFVSHLATRRIDNETLNPIVSFATKSLNEAEKHALDLAVYDTGTECLSRLEPKRKVPQKNGNSRRKLQILQAATSTLDCGQRHLLRQLRPIPLSLSLPIVRQPGLQDLELSRHYLASCRTTVQYVKRTHANEKIKLGAKAESSDIDMVFILTYPSNTWTECGYNAKDDAQSTERSWTVKQNSLFSRETSSVVVRDLGNPFFTNHPEFLDQHPSRFEARQLEGRVADIEHPVREYYCDSLSKKILRCLRKEDRYHENGYSPQPSTQRTSPKGSDVSSQRSPGNSLSVSVGSLDDKVNPSSMHANGPQTPQRNQTASHETAESNLKLNTIRMEILLWASDRAIRSFRYSYHSAERRLEHVGNRLGQNTLVDTQLVEAFNKHQSMIQETIYEIDSYRQQLNSALESGIFMAANDAMRQHQADQAKTMMLALKLQKEDYERVQERTTRMKDTIISNLQTRVTIAQLQILQTTSKRAHILLVLAILSTTFLLMTAIAGCWVVINAESILERREARTRHDTIPRTSMDKTSRLWSFPRTFITQLRQCLFRVRSSTTIEEPNPINNDSTSTIPKHVFNNRHEITLIITLLFLFGLTIWCWFGQREAISDNYLLLHVDKPSRKNIKELDLRPIRITKTTGLSSVSPIMPAVHSRLFAGKKD